MMYGIFANISHKKSAIHVGKYISLMDPSMVSTQKKSDFSGILNGKFVGNKQIITTSDPNDGFKVRN